MNYNKETEYSAGYPCLTGLIRSVTWVNILIQLAFPLAVTVSPVMAAAASRTVAQNGADPFGQNSAVYTLSAGETVQSVADKFHISLDALRQLNQLRTFAHGFDHLQAGDELDVPESPTFIRKNTEKTPGDAGGPADAQLAGEASRAGAFLASHPDGDAAMGMARGMAGSAAGGELQSWLSRFGTARVQLDVDNKFSLKNSEVDLLVPLWERQNDLFFTQGSIHRTDDRSQMNLGVGNRWFQKDYMLGANMFFDYDISREHRRGGIGAEYWRDYLKLSTNGYLRLSGWKDSKDFNNYEERPANGWDLRSEGWLPAWPHLGGKLTYEQYYGNSVALFGRDHRQHNPNAVTLGLNYTPFPLLTFNVDERQGKGSESDTRMGISLNWQPGVPLAHQLDPDGVNALRTLSGNRYDLVDRNNDIVLEYRKKEDITLRTIDRISGLPGEKKSLGVSVNAPDGFDHIEWSTPGLPAGSIVHEGGLNYSVILPEQQNIQTSNTWVITGVATDKKGHRSEPAKTILTVTPDTPDETHSTFGANGGQTSSVPADGTTPVKLVFHAIDAQGHPVSGLADKLQFAVADEQGGTPAESAVTVSKIVEAVRAGGTYEATLTGTRAGKYTVTPQLLDGRKTGKPLTVTLTAGTVPDGASSQFTASKPTIMDNGDSSLLTFTAKDRYGNLITGLSKVTFAVSPGAGGHAGAVSEHNGVYTAQFSGTQTGNYTITPQVNDTVVGSLSQTITVTADRVPDAGKSSFTLSSSTVSAGSTTTLTFTAKDASGSAITGLKTVKFETNTGVTVSSPSDTGNGVYTATLTGGTAGSYPVTPEVASTPLTSLKKTVTVTAEGSADTAKSSFTVPSSLMAGNSSAVKFTAKDRYGNLISGKTLTFSVSPSSGLSVGGTTENNGVYTASISGTTAQSYTLTPVFNGTSLTSMNETVTITADSTPDNTKSTFTAATTSVRAGVTDVLTFTAKDGSNNSVGNLGQKLTFELKNSSAAKPQPSDANIGPTTEGPKGTYTVTLTGNKADTYTITPVVSGAAMTAVTVRVDAGTPDRTQSTFDKPSPDTIVANGSAQSTLTYHAKDAHQNAVSGIANQLTFVVKQNGTVVASGFTESSATESVSTAGTYTVTLTGTAAGTYALTPQIDSVDAGPTQNITLTAPASQPFAGIASGGKSFGVSDGFPTTGFENAKFTLSVPAGKAATDYTWKASKSWVSINPSTGEVTFASKPSTSSDRAVTITATPTTGGASLAYTFTLTHWLRKSTAIVGDGHAAIAQCQAAGLTAAPTAMLTAGSTNSTETQPRKVGSLYGEWGDISNGYGWDYDVMSADGDDVDLSGGWYSSSGSGPSVCYD
ncbi:inverse autotransporter beta domain-containing protein [Enterobacter asburiae]|uniref:inverse autotransporter beta domain-containing protein n=1 Tax=Enterobacter asburiae TaxID=61645 RepID=UPI003F56BB33